MTTSTNRQIDESCQLPRRQRVHRAASITTGGCRRCTASAAIWPAATSRATPRRSLACRKTPSTVSSVPTRTTRASTESRRRCSGHAGSVSFGKISGESTRFSSLRRLQDAGLRHQRSRLHAPRRRTNQSTTGSSGAISSPARFVRTRNFNINQYAGWNFGGDRLYSGGNINSHWTFTNYYSIGVGFNLDAAPFRDRVTRGGPGVLGNPSQEHLVLRQHRQPQGAVVLLQRQPLGRHANSRAPRHQSRRELARDLVDVAHRPASATRSTTTIRSG